VPEQELAKFACREMLNKAYVYVINGTECRHWEPMLILPSSSVLISFVLECGWEGHGGPTFAASGQTDLS
jgi:hypothetical protein